jgi:hypothetical protein
LSDAINQLKGGNRQSAEAMMRQIVGLPPLPAAPPMPTGGTPNLSDAINQLKGGNRQGGEELMRQIVGLPPLPAQGQPPGDGTIGVDYFGPGGRATIQPVAGRFEPQPNIEKPITTMPAPDPSVAAPYPQAPFGNPAQSQREMQQYLNQQNLLAQRMNQQRNPMAGPNPYMQQQQQQYQQQRQAAMNKIYDEGVASGRNVFDYSAVDKMVPPPVQQQQPPMGRDLYGMPMPLPQQPMGPSSPMTMDIKRPYNPGDDQLIASMMQQTQQPGFLGNTAPQQPMQQQPPMERLYDAPSSPMGQPLIGSLSGQQLGQQQPMGQFQQNNAQQMSNFQNQNQPAQNTQQRSGGMFGRRFGGGSFGGNSGGGGGGLF